MLLIFNKCCVILLDYPLGGSKTAGWSVIIVVMRICLFTLLALVWFPIVSFAQGLDAFGNEFINVQTKLEVRPSYPNPGQVVQITLDDYAGGSFGSAINWFSNGEPIPNTNNQRNISIFAGGLGSETIISAVLTNPDGRVETITHTLRPLYLDIIIEPQTHVPDFYVGRALPSFNSTIVATALLAGIPDRPADLVYTWRVEREVLEGGALRGQNKISFTVPRGRSFVLSLEVADATGAVVARRSLSLPSVDPQLRFYEVNDLYGVSQIPISSSYRLVANSVSILAVPYNLDSQVFNNPDLSVWEVSGTEYQIPGNPYLINLSKTGDTALFDLSFHVRSLSSFLQGAEDSIRVSY